MIGDAGRASEKRLGKKMGGRLRPVSGAMTGAKGDIDLGDVLMEAKSTITDSLTVHFAWLAKIEGEALRAGKKPALGISFTKMSGASWPGGDWVCVPLADFLELMNERR
jgi:hypothetical protein